MNSDQGKPGVYIPPHRRRKKIEASMDSLPVPSETKDRKYVIMPRVEKVVDDDEEWMACGKWMWYNTGNTAHMDEVWKELQRYLSDGTFLMIKASTAAMTFSPGVILCYTKPEKEAIKRAAKAIWSVTKGDTTLYYKVNRHTELNIARRYGQESISLYTYTAEQRLYRRNCLNRLILDEDCSLENKLAYKSYRGNISLKQLPSDADNNKVDLRQGTYVEKDGSTGWWSITCDNSNKEECGCTEADRIWATVNKLYEEETFQRIVYFREAQVVYISCYVTNFSKIESLTSGIKKVIKNVQLLNPIYFFIYNNTCDETTWKYKLTAEGEHYELFCHKGFSLEKFFM